MGEDWAITDLWLNELIEQPEISWLLSLSGYRKYFPNIVKNI
jgi:hypothetical protein